MMDSIRYFLRKSKRFVLLLRFVAHDFWRYCLYCSKSGTVATRDQLPARLIVQYHAIEKGLALPDVRLGFGVAHIQEIFRMLDEWHRQGLSESHLAFRGAIGALEAYVAFHRSQNHPVHWVEQELQTWQVEPTKETKGGTLQIKREDLLRSAQGQFCDLVKSRHSVRQFDDRPIDISLIEQAVTMAQRSPSACNRQSCRVYVVRDEGLKIKVLECQIGNRGFREQVGNALVITSDLSDFSDPEERNQAYIDGGMFAMTLVLSFHHLGLGSCALAWSGVPEREREVRRLLPIKKSETIVMFLALGHLPEKLVVARSERKPLDEVLRVF